MTRKRTVEEPFRSVVDVFDQLLASGADVGAALSIYVEGRKVVDVWGGTADPASGRLWSEDTMVPVFSCSKGVLTLCLLSLVDDGRVSLTAQVADYWPEFAAAGKENITVADVMTHRAGLPMIDADLTLTDLLEWDPVITALENQEPLWQPGTAHAYHAVTFGWLVGEIIHRVTGETPGQFLRSHHARTLGLDTWIGLPTTEHHRVATLLPSVPEATSPAIVGMIRDYLEHDDRVLRAVTMNGALRVPFPGVGVDCDLNDPAVWSGEIPAGNCITTARSLAKLYASAVGPVEGRAPILSNDLRQTASSVRTSGAPFFGLPGAENRWGIGFQVSNPTRPMLGTSSFGHDGTGGELAFADYDAGVGFAYVHNQMGGIPDSRANDLVDTLRSCLRTD